MTKLPINLPAYRYPSYKEIMENFEKRITKERNELLNTQNFYDKVISVLKTIQTPLSTKVMVTDSKTVKIQITISEDQFFVKEVLPILQKFYEIFGHMSSKKGTYHPNIHNIIHILADGKCTILNTLIISINLPVKGCKDIRVSTRERVYYTFEYNYAYSDPIIEKFFSTA